MACPFRHIADYTESTVEEAAEIAALTIGSGPARWFLGDPALAGNPR